MARGKSQVELGIVGRKRPSGGAPTAIILVAMLAAQALKDGAVMPGRKQRQII